MDIIEQQQVCSADFCTNVEEDVGTTVRQTNPLYMEEVGLFSHLQKTIIRNFVKKFFSEIALVDLPLVLQ